MHVQGSVQESFNHARVVARKAVAKLPASTRRGFDDGHRAGRDFAENVPYIAGAAVGFVYGAGEAVVEFLATPAMALYGWVIGEGSQGEGEGEAEVA